MTRLEAWFLHVATLLVGGGGLVYAWMRYLARPDDPFAVVNHPWQPAVQHLHVLAAPLLVFAIGLIWKAHAWPGRPAARRRAPERAVSRLVATAAPMIASGYLLQTATVSGLASGLAGDPPRRLRPLARRLSGAPGLSRRRAGRSALASPGAADDRPR